MAKDISSGGLGAVFSTLKHAIRRTGLLRSSRALLKMNSEKGFDCPGCAWPEPKDRSHFEFCENGAKTLMNATTTKMVDEKFLKSHSIKELLSWSDYALTNCGRLVTPFLKSPHHDHFQPITYAHAFDLIKEHINKLKNPDRAVFYTSGRASNEAAFLYQLFARALGTNNLCDCSNLCHESSGVALNKTIGVGKGTVQLEDFLNAQIIFLIGHNPATNHPRMLSTLQEAKKKGAKIVVINPLVEPGLKLFRHPQKPGDLIGPAKEIATHYFQVNIGGDLALFNALAYQLIYRTKECAKLDNDFIHSHTENFISYKNTLKAIDFNSLKEASGLLENDIVTIADLIAHHDRVIYAWGMGITQTTYGVNTIEAIANLALLRGHIGKAGAGLCPVRGHSNVQGNRTVGITEKPSEKFLNRLKERFQFTPPAHHGLDVVQSIHAMINDQVDFFMALGGNFLSASPDTEVTSEALRKVDLAVNIATSLNRTHLVAGKRALILPCLTRVEKDVQQGQEQTLSVENSMSIVHASRGHFKPIREGMLSEVAIIAQIGKRVMESQQINWQQFNDNYEFIRDAIAACLDDFQEYNLKIKNPDGFLLPNQASMRKFFGTGKAHFYLPKPVEKLREDYDLLLTTIRSHDQFNTSIYGLNDRYRRVKNQRDVIFLHEQDIKRLNLSDGMRVDVMSCYRDRERIARGFTVRQYEIKPGSAAAYFPEANALVPLDSVALESNTPTSKRIPIKIRPCQNIP